MVILPLLTILEYTAGWTDITMMYNMILYTPLYVCRCTGSASILNQSRGSPLEQFLLIFIRGVTRPNKLAGHNKGLLIMNPYIYIGSVFLVAGHSKHLARYMSCCRYTSDIYYLKTGHCYL